MTVLVRNVSDTARWVATYRAEETARPDALFSDPLAARLAGERGPAIAQRATRHSRWALVTRTCVIDQYVNDVIREGSDCILNLAAGFDTRPHRLELPSGLRWIEADLPELVAEKNQLLEGEHARCQLEREAVDLSDPAALDDFLARRLTGVKNATVITEGLVIYLDEAVVARLARSLARHSAIRSWILDFNSPRIKAEMSATMNELLGSAPFKFAPENGVAFFETLGWKAHQIRSLFHEGARLKRVPFPMRLFAVFPPPNPRALGSKERWGGVIRLKPNDPA